MKAIARSPRAPRKLLTSFSTFFFALGLLLLTSYLLYSYKEALARLRFSSGGFGLSRLLLRDRHDFPNPQRGRFRGFPDMDEPAVFDLGEVLLRVGGQSKTVIMVQVTSNYIDFLENWYASVAQQGYGRQVVFMAEDLASWRFLKTRFPWQTAVVPWVLRMWPVRGPCPQIDWNSTYFNTVVSRRPFYLKSILDYNVTVLYNDIDIVWQGDPFPFLTGSYDMWVQEDGRVFRGALERFSGGKTAAPRRIQSSAHQICTCFMMLRPTNGTREMMVRWGRSIIQEMNRQGKPVANQGIWNKVLLATPESKVRIAVLPVIYFPSGCIFFGGTYDWCKREQVVYLDAIKALNATPVVVHNNWYAGHDPKLERFKKHKLWLLDGVG